VTGGGAYTDAKVSRDLEWDGDGCPIVVDGLNRCHSGHANFDLAQLAQNRGSVVGKSMA
jgi:hypothetical protein